ncbi:Leucine-rich repeat domain L domain-like [Trinorchestia longiramus]|nr:Leucine-rich repeat domain L domain-like [Trinorchestia longiramus]
MASAESGVGTVTCSQLNDPEDIAAEVPVWTQRLIITDSTLVSLHGDHLAPLTSLVSLVIRRSKVALSSTPWPSELPLQELVLDNCWSSPPNISAVFSTRPQKYLQLQPKVWSQLSRLRRLELIACSIRVEDGVVEEPGFDVLPTATFFSIVGGEFECHASHLYLLDMVAAGRASISHNTSCFILDDISKFNSFYTFNEKPLLEVLKLRKVRLILLFCNCVISSDESE